MPSDDFKGLSDDELEDLPLTLKSPRTKKLLNLRNQRPQRPKLPRGNPNSTLRN
jgi:hypothetical protein